MGKTTSCDTFALLCEFQWEPARTNIEYESGMTTGPTGARETRRIHDRRVSLWEGEQPSKFDRIYSRILPYTVDR